ncbi:MAG TPA: sugar phosphate isomerase/epimerase family protein [Candidatus Sulfotelmatobacter sp.]
MKGDIPVRITRRKFLAGIGAVAAATAAASLPGRALVTGLRRGQLDSSIAINSPFRVAIINDEISQDFGRACEVASREFGMQWIELRGMWKKNILHLDTREVAEAQRILAKFQLRVTDIASPLFKVDWKGAPQSKFSMHGDFHADFSFDQQDEVLERGIELAKAFQTDRVRCFDFWRLDDRAPYRAAINEKLLDAANKAGKKGIKLLLENDSGLNTATGAEAAKVLDAVRSPFLMMNWDPGNTAASGEVPFPDGYNLLPKDRIGHCHCKDAVKKGNKNDYDWAPMGAGVVDWLGQFKALKRDGYRFAVSLETHWDGGGTPEKSSRRSWAGMKEVLQKAGAL